MNELPHQEVLILPHRTKISSISKKYISMSWKCGKGNLLIPWETQERDLSERDPK
jgi:hypothetical protein